MTIPDLLLLSLFGVGVAFVVIALHGTTYGKPW
jgi:hypothetical protein